MSDINFKNFEFSVQAMGYFTSLKTFHNLSDPVRNQYFEIKMLFKLLKLKENLQRRCFTLYENCETKFWPQNAQNSNGCYLI